MLEPTHRAQPVFCRTRRAPLFVAIALTALCGCGYRAGTTGALGSMRTLHVAPVAVDAREVGASGILTRALREELAARTGLRLASESRAALVLSARLHAYDRAGLAFPVYAPGRPVRVGELRTTAKVSALLRRRADGRVLLDTGALTFTTEHLPGPDVMGTEANRERALRQLAADLARRIAELIADAF